MPPPGLETELTQLINHCCSHPHQVLGLVSPTLIRVWSPESSELKLIVKGEEVTADRAHPSGLFEYHFHQPLKPLDYQIVSSRGEKVYDPYAFPLTIGDVDLYLYAKGEHYDLYRVMGARKIENLGLSGVRFAVWAPHATRVSVVGDFNQWDGRRHPMTLLGQSGVWELFVPELREGSRYKFEIRTSHGDLLLKADPFALASEKRPSNASVVADYTRYKWTDHEWMSQDHATNIPMAVYELHLGSWKQEKGEFLNYRQLAPLIADYVIDMGFTHVELLPITEHPLDESWGYQVSGYFAVTSRFGTPQDFQFFIDFLHQRGIGVILDWVPAHFPDDPFSLGLFDGTPLYEHEDPKKGYHPHWETHIFEFGHPRVSNFLIASALFWLKEMHIDALRVDAVASMIYLDYGRHYGQWEPNRFGGIEYLEAIAFLKHLNTAIKERVPRALMIAEESTSFPGITASPDKGGLGFDFKWNMGWMNDTLDYFTTEHEKRPGQHHHLSFPILYAFQERYFLPISHDEIVHEKKSLIGKMPGDISQKFANLRLFYSYLVCQPGKFLMFMGGDFGQLSEWNCKQELDWDLLDQDMHKSYNLMCKELNHLYQNHEALWQKDETIDGFEWVTYSDRTNSVIAYLRKSDRQTLLCVHNFQPRTHSSYYLKIKTLQTITLIFSTDHPSFGGWGTEGSAPIIAAGNEGVTLSIAPLATQIYEVQRA